MRILLQIVFVLSLLFNSFTDITYAAGDVISDNQANLNIWEAQERPNQENDLLRGMFNSSTDYRVAYTGWEKWIRNLILLIARDIKNVFFIVAGLYFLFLVLRLLFADKSDEEVDKFKKWVIWTSVWIVVMQISYGFINVLFDKDITDDLADRLIDVIMLPFINLLQTGASFAFMAIMIYAAFQMFTANGNEETIKKSRLSILYAAIWFLVVKITNALVYSIYWEKYCWNNYLCVDMQTKTNVGWIAQIIVEIINWMNGFVWIIVILMIIYAGFLTIFSNGDEEKMKKAKNIILYVVIGLWILVVNYLILTFFIFPETQI